MKHQIILVVLFVSGCLILTRLGVWQLQRAEEKRQRHGAYSAAFEQRPLSFELISDNDAGDYLWRRTFMSGQYREPVVLLDNRTHNGRPGYEVLSAFSLAGGRTVMVERGWIAMPSDRTIVPSIETPTATVSISGYLGPDPVVGIRLNEASSAQEQLAPGILRVQRLDLDGLAVDHQTPLWPNVLYLDDGQPGAFNVDRKLPGDGSAKHRAYAVQWFSMAAILAGIGIWNLRRRRQRL